MLTLFSDYNAIKSSVNEIIAISGYKNEYIAKKIGLSSQNFAVKKQRNNWTSEELEKIIKILTIPNQDVEELIMLQIMRSRKDDETLTYDEYKKETASWK